MARGWGGVKKPNKIPSDRGASSAIPPPDLTLTHLVTLPEIQKRFGVLVAMILK